MYVDMFVCVFVYVYVFVGIVPIHRRSHPACSSGQAMLLVMFENMGGSLD